MPTCCGWTPHTQWIPAILVLTVVHAPPLLVCLPMWNPSRQMLMSSSRTSSLDQLAPQFLAQHQALHQVQHRHLQLLHLPQHHLIVLVVLWTIASICALLMSLRSVWSLANAGVLVCSSEQIFSFSFISKCDLACLRVSDASMFFT